MTTVKAELLNIKQKHVAIESARSSEVQTLQLFIASLKSDFRSDVVTFPLVSWVRCGA